MLKSMTGFGAVSFDNDTVSIMVEVKSINSKSQDFSSRLPRAFQDKEIEVKNLLGQVLERGKVSLSIDFSRKGSVKPKLTINPALFKAYYDDIKKNADAVGMQSSEILRIVTGLPEVFDVDKTDEEIEHDWDTVFNCIKDAVKKCEDFRKAEGKVLEGQLASYIATIQDRLNKITTQDPERIAKVREKLTSKVEEFITSGKIDNSRFEQELIYYIEKLDITEEKVRLQTHLNYFMETMSKDDANGKKLGFISQEIGREINTIGSKANDAHIQKWVVEMKEELEKIKEQSLNVL
jgi:uncharacterized protein (TIGR00255 family)